MNDTPMTLVDFELPYAPDTEALLLCEMISMPDTINDVRGIVSETMFFDSKAKTIWKDILKKDDAHEHIDLTTVWSVAEDKEYFKEKIVSRMNKTSTTPTGVIEHSRVLRDVYIKRMTYLNAVKTLTLIQDGKSVDALESEARVFREALNDELRDDSTQTMAEVMNEITVDIQEKNEAKIRFGIPHLDFYFNGGFSPGNLVILAARPSVGKTALAIQAALYEAERKSHVLFFSLEMENKELGKRALLSTGTIKPVDFHSRKVDWNLLERGIGQVGSEYLHLADKCFTIDEIVSKIGVLAKEGKCDIVYIDYLGLISTVQTYTSMVRQISDITKLLKQTAKKFRIPIILLCQLNRSSASEGRSPQLYDLRDSGSIEQDADIVMMLERARDTDTERNIVDIWLRKNRAGGGRDSSVRVEADAYYTNFKELDEQWR